MKAHSLALLVVLGACGSEPQTTLLSQLRDEASDAELTFSVSDSGTLFVTEIGGPLLERFIAQEATPLEVFIALAPDRLPPPALVEHHARMTTLAPRQQLRDGPVRDQWINSLTAADCAADGTWFDSMWSAWGWGWHWYYAGTNNYKEAPSKVAKNYVSHFCTRSNHGWVLEVQERLVWGGIYSYRLGDFGQSMPIDRRGLIWATTSATDHTFSARLWSADALLHPIRFGVMSP